MITIYDMTTGEVMSDTQPAKPKNGSQPKTTQQPLTNDYQLQPQLQEIESTTPFPSKQRHVWLGQQSVDAFLAKM